LGYRGDKRLRLIHYRDLVTKRQREPCCTQKAIATQDTAGWLDACRLGGHAMCRIGNPYPEGAEAAGLLADAGNWTYNCYINEKIENFYVP